jgi:hypothetical protein
MEFSRCARPEQLALKPAEHQSFKTQQRVGRGRRNSRRDRTPDGQKATINEPATYRSKCSGIP